MLYSRSLLVMHFEYSSVYMTFSSSLTIPLPHPPPPPALSRWILNPGSLPSLPLFFPPSLELPSFFHRIASRGLPERPLGHPLQKTFMPSSVVKKKQDKNPSVR